MTDTLTLRSLHRRMVYGLIRLDSTVQELGDALGSTGASIQPRAAERRRLRAQAAPAGFWVQRRPCGALAIGAKGTEEFALDGSPADLLEFLCHGETWKPWESVMAHLGNGKPLTRRALIQRVYLLRQALQANGVNPYAVVCDRRHGLRFAVAPEKGGSHATA